MLRSRWARFAAAGAALTAAYPLLPLRAQTLLYTAVGVASLVAVVAGVRDHRPARPAPWVLIGVGVLLWVVGDVAYSLYEVDGTPAPFPSYADALYLLGYPAATLGVLLVVRRSGVRDVVAWQDAAMWLVGVVLLSWEWLIEPNLEGGGSRFAQAVALAFPLLDLVLLLLLLRLAAGRHRSAVTCRVLALSLGCYLVSDAVYGVQVVEGTYVSGSAVDLGWLAAYVGIGAAALHPSMRALTEPAAEAVQGEGRLRLVLLGLTALVAPGTLVLQHLALDHVHVVQVAVATALLVVLTTLRGAGLLGELEVLARELRGREEELHQRATRDALTGLANRDLLAERLEADLAGGEPFAVVLLDLDDFKSVNDARGHEAGDDLLLQVADRLLAATGDGDLAVRLGGDEFAVVSSRCPQALADRVLARLAPPVRLGGVELTVRASVGVALGSAAATPSELLRCADIAMYVAKRAGGRQAVTYDPAMSEELLVALQTRERLALGVERQELAAWLQPVVDLQDGALLGFEALARWQRPGEPPEAPGRWMPTAEETGLVVDVDAQVLRAAVRQLVDWTARHPGAAALDLAVNASGRSLAEPDAADRVLQVLREEGLPGARLVLEVTEGVLIDDAVGERLQRLREAGVRIALDDFGTGWSSLSYLRRFPVDVLKLDRSFVTGVADDAGARAVAAAVVQLAAALGVDVVAEGVETAVQAEALRGLGCRAAQGFLLARPAPAADLEPLLRAGRVPAVPGPAAEAPAALLPDAQPVPV